MRNKLRSRIAGFFCALFLFFGVAARAQQLSPRPEKRAARDAVYEAARETVLEGTVLSFADKSAAPPLGARVVLQTANGAVDVHLGSAAFLHAGHFPLSPGDFVRVIGVHSPVREGSVFLARVIQKGAQSLALCTPQGAPLGLAGARALGAPKTQQPEGAR